MTTGCQKRLPGEGYWNIGCLSPINSAGEYINVSLSSLADPAGKIVAVAAEITVPVDDPAGFRAQGGRPDDKE